VLPRDHKVTRSIRWSLKDSPKAGHRQEITRLMINSAAQWFSDMLSLFEADHLRVTAGTIVARGTRYWCERRSYTEVAGDLRHKLYWSLPIELMTEGCCGGYLQRLPQNLRTCCPWSCGGSLLPGLPGRCQSVKQVFSNKFWMLYRTSKEIMARQKRTGSTTTSGRDSNAQRHPRLTTVHGD